MSKFFSYRLLTLCILAFFAVYYLFMSSSTYDAAMPAAVPGLNEGPTIASNAHLKVIRTGDPNDPESRATRPGDAVKMHYRGTLVNSNGQVEEFDSSFRREKPFQFNLGTGMVIRGWDEGLTDMRVGEKRRLVIQPAFGYGARPVGPIPANSVLTFDVELLGIGATR